MGAFITTFYTALNIVLNVATLGLFIPFVNQVTDFLRIETTIALENLPLSVINNALGTLRCPVDPDYETVRTKLWYILLIIGSILLLSSSVLYIFIDSAVLKILFVSGFLVIIIGIILRSQDRSITSEQE